MDEVIPDPKPVVYARAVSVLNSRTVWLNMMALLIVVGPAIVQVLSSEDVVAVIPARFMPAVQAALATLNIVLRIATVRPVAFIAAGDVKVIPIPKIDPPAPPKVTD
jgi:hypothetical protein